MKPSIFIVIFLITLHTAHATPKHLHHAPALCQFLLNTTSVSLADLLDAKLVEPDDNYLFSPREGWTDHEHDTATLLANRLKRPMVLLPRLSTSTSVPAVDGIIFNDDGTPLRNFSLKTFVPSQMGPKSLNLKLLSSMRIARGSINRNYDVKRWDEIICGRLPPSTSSQLRNLECNTFRKVFGIIDPDPRPVTIVIDYTNDPTAVFSLGYSAPESGADPRFYLTLEADSPGLDLLRIMDRLRQSNKIKEYIFLGPHHLFSVTADGYQMTEYCDEYGHKH